MKMMILLVCLTLFSGKLWAACSTAPVMPQSWDLSSVAVTSSLPVGADIPGSQHTFSISGTCGTNGSNELSGDPIIACYYGNGTEIAGFPGVYSTGVEGIGIALTNSSGQRVVGGGVGCDTRNTSLGNLDSSLSYQIAVTLSLVKTANDISDTALAQSQTRFGLGCMLDQPNVPNATFGLGPKAFGHPGAGGSIGFADPEREVTFGFVTNTLGPYVLMDPRAQKLVKVLAACL